MNAYNYPTPMLRFERRQRIKHHIPDMDPVYETVNILQQWWSCMVPYGVNEGVIYDARRAYDRSMGEWRDVPVETEGHNQGNGK